MAPRLTPANVLRERILSLLATDGPLDSEEAKDRIGAQYEWTQADKEPFLGKGPNWRNRLQLERNRMAAEDLMEDGFRRVGRNEIAQDWALTRQGLSEAAKVTAKAVGRDDITGTDTATLAGQRPAALRLRRDLIEREHPEASRSIAEEAARREQLWNSLLAAGGPVDVDRGTLRILDIYGGMTGIFVHGPVTKMPGMPKGIAVSLLHTGKSYADELTESGVIYHYPSTKRLGHDESEIEAAKAAYRAGLPVFVIGPGSKSTTRNVHRGYIEDVDDTNRVLLVTFTRGQLPPPPTPQEEADPFNLTDAESEATFSQRRNRPNQVRFAFDVYKRYGTGCAVCGVNVKGLVQAAHLVPKKNGGADDARNGLPLCANHHLAFDGGYWCVDPDLKLHAKADGPALDDLAIIRADLSHLTRLPHQDALAKVWTDWESKQQPGPA